jgi:pimeloyl-ACP methyl ester carboxylesterase
MQIKSLMAIVLTTFTISTAHAEEVNARPRTPTVVFVHGAFADASSWNGVIPKLMADGYQVVAVANPLRGLASDSAYVSSVVKSIPGPVILVGHSYGGSVITNAAVGNDNVKGLVFVAGLAPDVGESAFGLCAKLPGSILGNSTTATPLPGGGNDIYVKQSEFRAPFAADLPEKTVKLLAATQRPLTEAAGNEGSGEPAWKTIPSWSIYGSADMAIPPAVQAFMADRARSRRTEVVKGASHVVMVSHPNEVAKMIREATQAALASQVALATHP